MEPRAVLQNLFRAALTAADPLCCLPPHLPPRPDTGRIVVIGAGKAAAAMAYALEQTWPGPLEGMVVTRYGHGLPAEQTCRWIEVIEAGHPVPDAAAVGAAQRLLERVSGLSAGDTVICLLSGGGSALLALPPPGIDLAEKQRITRALLKSGATIAEINGVRKHLSLIKGGRLATACYPARIFTFAISDVPGDHADIIASGPTVADPVSSAQALAILRRYAIPISAAVQHWLESAASESIKADDARLARAAFQLIATPRQSLDAAAAMARELGIAPLILSDRMEGGAREVAKVHAAIARRIRRRRQPLAAPCVILSGGETTVTVRGNGRGGRNAEFLLSLLLELRGEARIWALAADTDGIDGTENNAGCVLGPDSGSRAQQLGLDLPAFLADNDAYRVFAALDDLLVTGPTRTNVNDFRALLIV